MCIPKLTIDAPYIKTYVSCIYMCLETSPFMISARGMKETAEEADRSFEVVEGDVEVDVDILLVV